MSGTDSYLKIWLYSMVKNNTFNGIPLPDIVIMDSDGECKVWKHFGYEDFKGRL